MSRARESLGVNCYGSMFAENSIGQLDAPTLVPSETSVRRSANREGATRRGATATVPQIKSRRDWQANRTRGTSTTANFYSIKRCATGAA
jgi:hypothetical protein